MSDEQPTLLDVSPAEGRRLPERIAVMYRAYGRMPGKRCRTCKHFYWRRSRSGRTKWGKCDLNYQGSLAGTDWSSIWPACGHWEAQEDADEEPAAAEPDRELSKLLCAVDCRGGPVCPSPMGAGSGVARGGPSLGRALDKEVDNGERIDQ
jgi:hypothetical protein